MAFAMIFPPISISLIFDVWKKLPQAPVLCGPEAQDLSTPSPAETDFRWGLIGIHSFARCHRVLPTESLPANVLFALSTDVVCVCWVDPIDEGNRHMSCGQIPGPVHQMVVLAAGALIFV